MTHSIHDVGHRPAKSWTGFLSLSLTLALVCLGLSPQAARSAEKEKQQISRVIAKEMTAAQKAMQASQWAEAIKNLEAAETKPGLNAFDKKTIYDFKGFAYVRLNSLKPAQQAYEQAIATGAYSAEDLAKTIRILFRVTASTQQNVECDLHLLCSAGRVRFEHWSREETRACRLASVRTG